MWISTVHIVVVYFCAYSISAEIRSKFEHNHRKSIVKRSVGAYNYKNKYISDNYNSYNSLSNLKIRHQSRFPNLEKVMTRINNMQLGSDDRNKKSEVNNRLRHSTWYERKTTTTTTTAKPEETFENYFDDDYENDKEDENNWEYEDDTDYEDYEGDGVFSSEWQAEEPTEKPTTSAPVHRQMSKISEMKWQMYGTRQKVEENRKVELYNNNIGSETSATLARVHFMRVTSEVACKKPLPRVISVQSEHPDPSRSYTPHCTVLHRCAEDTGCCLQNNKQCGPKTQKEVHLYFYAKTLGTLQSKIEKLTFWNHTECTCVEKIRSDNSNENSRIQFKSSMESKGTAQQNLERCTCPGSFSPKPKYESQCTCSCEETNPDCISMKNGLEYFSLADRKCVLERKCGIPICEFGAYLRLKGRCPRKQEKLDAFEHLTID